MADPFHVRFNIDLPVEEAQRRFINRIENEVRTLTGRMEYEIKNQIAPGLLDRLMMAVEKALGEVHDSVSYDSINFVAAWRRVVKSDFLQCLRAVEAVREYLYNNVPGTFAEFFAAGVKEALSLSETDLGISWGNGIFTRKGAKVLDEALVNEPLRWLADPGYRNVVIPFKKGLKHFLEGGKEPERLADAITDMYEATEAIAKIVAGKPAKDLSALREEFVSKLGLPEPYKKMLREYIEYGCDFRHALEQGKPRSWPAAHEAEGFVYLTGLFIRLAIESLKQKK